MLVKECHFITFELFTLKFSSKHNCIVLLLWSPSEKENRKHNIWDLCHLFCPSDWCVRIFRDKNIFPGMIYVMWEMIVRFLGLSPRFNTTAQTIWLWPAELFVYFTLITLDRCWTQQGEQEMALIKCLARNNFPTASFTPAKPSRNQAWQMRGIFQGHLTHTHVRFSFFRLVPLSFLTRASCKRALIPRILVFKVRMFLYGRF